MRMGSEQANKWFMATLSPEASLPLRDSTVVRLFLLWLDRRGGSQLLQDERGLGKRLGVQWLPVLVRLDGNPCGEAGRDLVP
jgi:hypothetical protein